MKGRRTDLPTAALVKVLKETEGRSENEISSLTGIPAGTVHNIISGAHGWGKIADGIFSSGTDKNRAGHWSRLIER